MGVCFGRVVWGALDSTQAAEEAAKRAPPPPEKLVCPLCQISFEPSEETVYIQHVGMCFNDNEQD